MNMAGREGSRLHEEVSTPSASMPLEGYGSDGWFGGHRRLASHLLPTSSSRFWWDISSRGRFLIWIVVHLFFTLMPTSFLWPVLVECQ